MSQLGSGALMGTTAINGSGLPRLMDQRRVAEELGVTRAAAEKIMQQVPKVHVEGLRKVYVRRDDVIRIIEEGTRR